MKHKNTIQNIVLIILVTISFFLRSDTIPSNSHAVDRNVVITNCDAFPNIQLVGFVTGVMLPKEPIYAIEKNQELYVGYKLNSLNIFGIKKSTLESIGGIENLTEEYINTKTIKLHKILSSGTYYINNSSSLVKDELFYEIVESNEDTLKIELRKRILTFDDEQKTINY